MRWLSRKSARPMRRVRVDLTKVDDPQYQELVKQLEDKYTKRRDK